MNNNNAAYTAITDIKSNMLDYSCIGDNTAIVCPDNIIEKARKVVNISDTVANTVKSNIMLFSILDSSLHRGCSCTNCNIKGRCMYRCSPNGDINADIIVIKAMPSNTDLYCRNAFSDSSGLIAREILLSAGATSTYFTNMLKCSDVNGINADSVKECMNAYTMREICDIVRPKMIIMCGQITIGSIKKYGFLPNFSPQKLINGQQEVKYSSNVTGNTLTAKAAFMYDIMNDANAPSFERETERMKQIISTI